MLCALSNDFDILWNVIIIFIIFSPPAHSQQAENIVVEAK